MLKPSNVGYAATCNSVGQQIGWLMGFVVFTSLGGQQQCSSSVMQRLDSLPLQSLRAT